MFKSREPMKKTAALLALSLAAVGARADSSGAASTNAVSFATTGTNAVLRIMQGTNAIIVPTRGTNLVVQIVQLSNAAPAKITYPWVSSLAAGLTITRGNSDTTLFTAKFQTQKKHAPNEWLFGADGSYGVNQTVLSADSLHGEGQFNHDFDPAICGFILGDALHDGIQELAYRVGLSPGTGYHFVKSQNTSLVGELGPGVVSERRGPTRETYLSLRAAEHFDQKLSPTAHLWEKVEVIPQVSKLDNYIINAEFGVETALTRQLSLQLTLVDAYANDPASGRKDNDLKLISGIVYKF
jgi:putative salt-induced outer membrane protein